MKSERILHRFHGRMNSSRISHRSRAVARRPVDAQQGPGARPVPQSPLLLGGAGVWATRHRRGPQTRPDPAGSQPGVPARRAPGGGVGNPAPASGNRQKSWPSPITGRPLSRLRAGPQPRRGAGGCHPGGPGQPGPGRLHHQPLIAPSHHAAQTGRGIRPRTGTLGPAPTIIAHLIRPPWPPTARLTQPQTIRTRPETGEARPSMPVAGQRISLVSGVGKQSG